MKKLLFISLTLFFVFSMASCEDDVEDILNPDDPRDRIVNTWTCEESDGSNPYQIDIVKDDDDDDQERIYIHNFHGLALQVEADYKSRTITIPTQTVDGHSISGSGSMAITFLSFDMDYTIDSEDVSAHCTIYQISK